ncbi:hypothetical protein BKA56DRAFT_585601 [Ilyonectria sp. MPI-CAGE-AT-0026]|nr:hypothetical protein BKA56DRAFT_585601 [Ilyonectria sp. MPI-CAGE-AT-0026]
MVRTRARCAADLLDDALDQPPQKRLRTSVATDPVTTDPVAFWIEHGTWPKRSSVAHLDMKFLEPINAWNKPAPPKLIKNSNYSASTTHSNQGPREARNAPYKHPAHKTYMEARQGTYMRESKQGIADASKRLVEDLLAGEQQFPRDTIFDDGIFEEACLNLTDKSETRIIQDISRLLVPSAETLALRNKSLKDLIESVNEGWDGSIPLLDVHPQPDYSVGFSYTAFTDAQLDKLSPFLGEPTDDMSFFLGTYEMHFPFLTCETTGSTGDLHIADRRNAYSMTLAMRAVTKLFCAVKRGNEVDREILAFSVSHDACMVQIYGHYPVFNGEKVKYYRHPIYHYFITANEGKDRWTAYRIIKNIYELWMPGHLAKLCSAIDQLPMLPKPRPMGLGYYGLWPF